MPGKTGDPGPDGEKVGSFFLALNCAVFEESSCYCSSPFMVCGGTKTDVLYYTYLY